MDSNLAPIVGQQITLTNTNAATVGPRIQLLLQRAALGECEVIVKGVVGGEQRGWYRTVAGLFQSDRAAETALSDAALRSYATVAGQALTYTAVPPGGSLRAGVDRDEDGYFDRDEIDAGSDPADPLSIPASPTATPTQTATATETATATATQTPTVTETPADTPTLPATATATPTDTSAPPVDTSTPTATDTPTQTPTLTATATATQTPTPTLTETATATATATTAVCTSGVTITEVKLKISRNLVPAGDERLKIKGEMQLAALSPPIDPVANGLEISVADQSGAPLFDLPIPGGALWKVNSSGTRWTYKDRDGTSAASSRSCSPSSTVAGSLPSQGGRPRRQFPPRPEPASAEPADRPRRQRPARRRPVCGAFVQPELRSVAALRDVGVAIGGALQMKEAGC